MGLAIICGVGGCRYWFLCSDAPSDPYYLDWQILASHELSTFLNQKTTEFTEACQISTGSRAGQMPGRNLIKESRKSSERYSGRFIALGLSLLKTQRYLLQTSICW